MHDLLRILLNDLPSAPEGFAAERRERWLDAWAAAVRYIYVDAPERGPDSAGAAESLPASSALDGPDDTAATEVLGPSELDRPSHWSRAAHADAETRGTASGASDAPVDPLGAAEPAQPARNSLEPAPPARNSVEPPPPARNPAESAPPARNAAPGPMPTRGGRSHGSSDPSTQPWYGFGPDQAGQPAERGGHAPAGPPPSAPPPPPLPSAPPPAPPPPAPRSRSWTVEDDARLVQRYRAGFTPEQLADLFGRSAPAVRERLMQLGVDRR